MAGWKFLGFLVIFSLLAGSTLWAGGLVVSAEGDVYLTSGKKSEKAKGGEEIREGVVVDASLGKALILIGEDQLVVVKEGMLKVQKIEGKTAGYLFSGGARWVVNSSENRSFYTPTGVITSANGNVLVKYLKNSNSTEVYLLEGKCVVRNIKDEIKERVTLSPLKITVVEEGKPPATMLLSLSMEDKRDIMNRYSVVENFRDRYQERRDLVELGVHLYNIESSRTSVFVYPDNTPFPGAYQKNYINRVFRLKGGGSIKVRWKVDEGKN